MQSKIINLLLQTLCMSVCASMLFTPVFASNSVSISFDEANNIQLDTGEKGCILQHDLKGGKPLVAVNLSAINGKPGANSTIKLRNGFNQYGAVGSLVVDHNDKSFEAAGESLKLHIEAARLFKTEDWEAYDEIQTKAEEMDETVDPRFTQLSISVDGISFSEYAAGQRTSTKFNSSKVQTVVISLKDVPIINPDAEDLIYDEADLSYEGVCNVIVMRES